MHTYIRHKAYIQLTVAAERTDCQLSDMQTSCNEAWNCVKRYGWNEGMYNALIEDSRKFQQRFVIVDDSGSMSVSTSTRVTQRNNKCNVDTCTRWSALVSSAEFQGELAEAMRQPATFHFLNKPSVITIGQGTCNLRELKNALDASPSGGTPLCSVMRSVISRIQSVKEQLLLQNQRAILVIMTDGESSDGDLLAAMRPLTTLPVFILLRLYTTEKKVVDYWAAIDEQIKLCIVYDVAEEAKEFALHNDWLTYSPQLHQFREWGVRFCEFDDAKIMKLLPDQVHSICNML